MTEAMSKTLQRFDSKEPEIKRFEGGMFKNKGHKQVDVGNTKLALRRQEDVDSEKTPLDQPEKFDLMQLPFDNREQILGYVACGKSTIRPFLRAVQFWDWSMAPTKIDMPAIARAGDRKLRQEVILVTLKHVTIEIYSGPGNQKLRDWLPTLDFSLVEGTSLSNSFGAIHKLRFPYFSYYPHHSLPTSNPNNDIVLMQACGNLRSVEISFAPGELIGESGWILQPKTVNRLRR